MRPDAVLLDLDGTLIDTEHAYVDAAAALVRSAGLPWSQATGEALLGHSMTTLADVLAGLGLRTPAEQVIAEVNAAVAARVTRAIPWLPGARAFLASLRAAGLRTALVTMSYRPVVRLVRAALPPLTFDAVVTGEDVDAGKPDPLPYRRAAGLLGVDPARCVAVEDSAVGAAAALAAGTVVVGVPSGPPLPDGLAHAHWPGGITGRTAESVVAAFAEAGGRARQ